MGSYIIQVLVEQHEIIRLISPERWLIGFLFLLSFLGRLCFHSVLLFFHPLRLDSACVLLSRSILCCCRCFKLLLRVVQYFVLGGCTTCWE